MINRQQLMVFRALLARQWFVIGRQLPDMFGDGLIAVSLQVIMLKYFLPAMGMSTQWQVPLFIGNMLMLCFTIGFQYGIGLTNDIATSKVLHYHASLPLSPRWTIISYLSGAMLSFFVLLVPVGMIGSWFLNKSDALHGSFIASIVMCLLVVLFFSLMFTYLAVRFSPEIYLDNMWPRLLGPMFTLGCLLFTWHRINTFSPKVSYLFLLSPATYCVEGLRHALLGDPQYLSLPLCMSMVTIFCVTLVWMLRGALRHRLDLVVAEERR